MLEARNQVPAILTQRELLRFWAPLTAMWLLMACDQPLITALIARLPEARENLAAFAVAFAISLLIETPVISFLSTTTALLNDAQSYRRLRSFVLSLNAACTLLHILVPLPWIFNPLAQHLLVLPPRVAELCQQALWFMIPWSGAIGFRRFYQGVMIKHNQTNRVAKVAMFRVLSLAGIAFVVFQFQLLPGAALGALALSACVSVEAVVARVLASSVVKRVLQQTPTHSSSALELRQILHFYIPLSLTILLGMCFQPLNTFAIGRAERSLDSLAILPVLGGLLFLVQSFALGLQETVIVLSGERRENLPQLKRFSAALGALLVSVMLMLAITPLGALWFRNVSGLSPDLETLASHTLLISILLPGLVTLNCFAQGVMMSARRTRFITYSTVCQLSAVCLVLWLAIGNWGLIGIYGTSLAGLCGSAAAALFLVFQLRTLK